MKHNRLTAVMLSAGFMLLNKICLEVHTNIDKE